LGRRRRRVVRIVKKKLPTVFVCPRCGEEAVRVSIDKATGKAIVACAICQLKDEFQAHPQAQAIDVYSYFTDRFYGVKDPRAIIPRDRAPSGPVDQEEEEAEDDVQEPVRLEQEVHGENPSETFEQQSAAVDEQNSKLEAGSSVTPNKSEVSSATEPSMTEEEKAQAKEEEENPFGDILEGDSDKEKKRYRSPNPLEQESSSSSSQ
jgi:transcription elongation factor Elf1